MSRVASQPLDPAAVAAADAQLALITGGRPLTMDPADAELRAMWMDAYIAAGGAVDGEDWGDAPMDDPSEGCPLEEGEEDEEHAWFFSA